MMIVRNATLMTLAVLVISSTGCTGMRNCLFGRGARCGLCTRVGAVGNALNPFSRNAGAPAAPCGSTCGTVAPPMYAPQAYAPTYGAPMVSGPDYGCSTGTCGEYAVGMPSMGGCESCQDGGVVYGGTDPYLGGSTYGSPVMGGEVIQGDAYYGIPGYGSSTMGDGFVPRTYGARKVDANGDVIVHEDPLPPGARFGN